MSGDGERRQRAVMATDEEWERIGRAAAANGMDRSRFVVHRALTRHTISGSTTPSGSSFGPATGSAGPATASRPGLASGTGERIADLLPRLANAVCEIPRGLLADAQVAVELHRRNPLEVRRHQVDRGEPCSIGPATGLSLHVMSAAPCGPTTRPTLPASPRKTPGATPAAYSPLSQSSALPPQSCNSALRLGVLRPCQRRVLSSFHERLPH